MRRTLAIIILIFFSVSAMAEKRLKWDAVNGAWGYYIEIRDSQKNIVVQETIRQNSYEISKLPHGEYSFRIATVNMMMQRGESTEWFEFTIEKLFVPELKSVTGREMLSTFNNTLVVRGSNFRPQSRFVLRSKGKDFEIDDIDLRSENEAVLSYKPPSSMKGQYDLAVINRGDAEAVIKDAVNIIEPEKAEMIFFAGAGYLLSMPVGEFSDYYAASYVGLNVFFQVSARNFGFENILLEAAIFTPRFTYASSSKESTLMYTALGLGAGYYYPVASYSVELFVKIQGGAAYTILTLDENLKKNEISSIDPFAMAGAGIRYNINEFFFVEPSLTWKTVFYTGTFFNDAGLCLNAGIRF